MNVVKLCCVKFIGLFLVSTLIACGHGVQPKVMVSVARKPVPVNTIQQQDVNGKLDFVVCTVSLCEKPTEKIIKHSEE